VITLYREINQSENSHDEEEEGSSANYDPEQRAGTVVISHTRYLVYRYFCCGAGLNAGEDSHDPSDKVAKRIAQEVHEEPRRNTKSKSISAVGNNRDSGSIGRCDYGIAV
jgi:hypothetical protein